jgi:hypothetical protein
MSRNLQNTQSNRKQSNRQAKRPLTLALVLGIALLAPQIVQAQTVVLDTLGGSGFTSDPLLGNEIRGSAVGSGYSAVAARIFTDTFSGNVSTIALPLTRIGSTGNVTVSLCSRNSPAFSPGSTLESWTVNTTTTPTLYTLTSVGTPLVANEFYWVTVTPIGINDGASWQNSNSAIFGVRATSITPGSWGAATGGNAQVPLYVTGTTAVAAPEPATLSLIAMGLIGGTGVAKRRRK